MVVNTNLATPTEARAAMFSAVKGLPLQYEEILTIDADGRVNADDIYSPQNLPNFVRSTVDGYAVIAADTEGASEHTPVQLKLTGEIDMGDGSSHQLMPGRCLLIHTGGMVPAGCDAVLMLEDTHDTQDGSLLIMRRVRPGENQIQVGEDIQTGEMVLARGKKIRPVDIGGLLSLGITKLRVAKRLRIGIISSGNEVVEPWQSASFGKVRNINSYIISSKMSEEGHQPLIYGISADDRNALGELARRVMDVCDVLIITAGTSASYRDHTAEVFNSLGNPGVLIHGIAVKPGKPAIMGLCGNKPVFGLPGNPVSAYMNTVLFVLPALAEWLGCPATVEDWWVDGELLADVYPDEKREEWIPVRIHRLGGTTKIEPIIGKSNLIFNLSRAEGVIKIPQGAGTLKFGAIVRAYSF